MRYNGPIIKMRKKERTRTLDVISTRLLMISPTFVVFSSVVVSVCFVWGERGRKRERERDYRLLGIWVKG
jgi:hypothetical protein